MVYCHFTCLPLRSQVTSGVGLDAPDVQFTSSRSPTVYSSFHNVICGSSVCFPANERRKLLLHQNFVIKKSIVVNITRQISIYLNLTSTSNLTNALILLLL